MLQEPSIDVTEQEIASSFEPPPEPQASNEDEGFASFSRHTQYNAEKQDIACHQRFASPFVIPCTSLSRSWALPFPRHYALPDHRVGKREIAIDLLHDASHARDLHAVKCTQTL